MAYLMHEFEMDYQFYTTTEKIKANYETDVVTLQQKVPERELFEKQLKNVLEQESMIENNKIKIYRRAVEMEEMKNFIRDGSVIILLINSLMIECMHCRKERYHDFHLSSLPMNGSTYRGKKKKDFQ